jgi:acyl-CoA synthetase (NDP forming)
MMESARKARPEARLQGVFLQREIPPGQDVIIGMVRDTLFGPMMMFGSGGVEVEGLKDVAFALAPLSPEEASRMLRRTWAGRKLKGFRNIQPVSEAAVTDALVRLSCLAVENEHIEEIEINPLRVLPNQAVALDVRMKISAQS